MTDEVHPRERTVGLAVLGVTGACFVLVAWWLVPWTPGPGRTALVADHFTRDEVTRAEHYSSWARVWSWSSLAGHLAVISAFLTPWGRSKLERCLRGPTWWRVTTAIVVVMATARLATMPLAVAAQQHRRNHSLSLQAWPSWGRDVLLSLVVSTATTTVAVLVLVTVMRRWRRVWPLVASALVAAAVVVGSWGYPLVVEPLFNSFEPMPAGQLRSDVLELADREGVDLEDVLIADASRRTTTLNAYVSGLGGTRRVVVYDTMVADVPPEQVLAVVAHELAHARHDDVLVGTSLGALGAAAGMGLLPLLLRRRELVAVVTTVLAVAAWGSVLAAPVENGISRQIEVRADQDALKATGDPVAFEMLQVELARRALADPTPPRLAHWWWGSHPTVLERLARAEQALRDGGR